MSKSTKSKKKTAPPRAKEVLPDVEEGDDRVIGQAFRWSLAVIAAAAVVVAAVVFWLDRPSPPAPVKQAPVAAAKVRERPKMEVPTVAFSDITHEAGIHFVHQNGAYGAKLLPETMGGGCAFFDYDNDGRPDLLLVNSCQWPWHTMPERPVPTMALYHNDGSGHFSDVTAESGLGLTFYGMGAAVGDYDNDGLVDVFISAVGKNHLFHNDGNGKFTEVTDAAGVAGSDDQWSTSCAWIDYDNDGRLDLFVCNYVKWSKEIDEQQSNTLDGKTRAYGQPLAFRGTYPYLYHNDGNGKFTEVSAEAGIQVNNQFTGQPAAKALGVAPIDLDGDGWIDLVVANDSVQNFVFHNQKNGKFKDIGAVAGIAFDPNGNTRGAMGIDTAYFRGNQTLGIAIGNFATEMTSLYVSRGPLQFADEAVATGLGPPSRLALKFGLFFFDYDLDSRLDLLTANGHLEEEINKIQKTQHYEQPPQLFWNCGQEERTEFLPVVAEKSGSDFVKPMVGRGATFADIDGDGDLDVLITSIGREPRLLRNDQKLGNHWLRFKLVGKQVNRDAIGAWVEVSLAGQTLRQQVMPTRSYLSQSELPVTFGLGQATKIDKVTIRWPGGASQEVPQVKIDTLTTVEQSP